MKLKGQVINARNEVEIVIPRGNSPEEYIVFTAVPVDDFTELNALLPPPEVPVKLLPGGERVADTDRPSYAKAKSAYEIRRLSWLVLKSLQDTEWDSVDMGAPSTWPNFENDLRTAGFSQMEVTHIVQKCIEVNGLSETALDGARKSFLAFRRARNARSSSQTAAPSDTPSGELVSV